MKYISHRGNINGPVSEQENHPRYIKYALDLDFDVEVDVWYFDKFWLGHDEPKYIIETNFLLNNKLWCHAKNLDALYQLSQLNTRFFWHENDKYTITSDKIIWAYPGQPLNSLCVCVLPELTNLQYKDTIHCYGICSDYIGLWNKS